MGILSSDKTEKKDWAMSRWQENFLTKALLFWSDRFLSS